ncbi:nitroreductase family deazaflavin-dependent oxidoreductase [Tomitella cavernea]|uniref:F420H(2)-dependent quinone reductase n=1 Tax=Tomitella cavernea TaxID=1387982 RepID=A0ABP9CJS5_9ACTN|nr:nitroreductase family deazaflavin-dependent oxidoreductase [Tomitella cavernea]
MDDGGTAHSGTDHGNADRDLIGQGGADHDRAPEYAPSPTKWVRDHVERYEGSGGTDGTELNGMPVVIVDNIGATSGKLRKTPVMRVEHGGAYAAVASKGGAPENPVWYRNLTKNPRVQVRDGETKGAFIAREVHGDERAVWWERAVAVFPPYAEYQEKTTRHIPVFVLEPTTD